MTSRIAMERISTQQASPEDAGHLADIRVAAMRPSLEALGRFDTDRARHRLLDGFCAGDTTLIKTDGLVAGFYVLRNRGDHLYLDHFYLSPDQQGKGIGRWIVETIKDKARSLGTPVRLMALRHSAANAFYLGAGFRALGSEGYDIHYQWGP
ncbi:GNAT family N-acetyltransferase [Fuscibacter oryzae]|uniref:GNAT family N-acetyltransferase n=1 Tax=Fuscibacter oryzae TaxID=2803939 RepID=A0A8J7MPA9_9RHOB|nr:GNAT family N-acetyltransferase [Fuscibacter oryzae]MBL4926992.1 GNAT family N-acetyltransferase [Fuscibacter oryzae]